MLEIGDLVFVSEDPLGAMPMRVDLRRPGVYDAHRPDGHIMLYVGLTGDRDVDVCRFLYGNGNFWRVTKRIVDNELSTGDIRVISAFKDAL